MAIEKCKICEKVYKVKNQGSVKAADYDFGACESCNLQAYN